LVIALLAAVHVYKTRNHPGGPAPRHGARLLSGASVTLGGKSSEPVLVHFWATWCGVCRMEEGSIESLSKSARVLSIAVHSGSSADVQRYMAERGLSFPVVNDPAGDLARAYGVHEYPSSFFVSPAGNIVTSEVGYTTSLGLKARMWLADW
jgi:thiol-disulfide isomerase/thioredoxin